MARFKQLLCAMTALLTAWGAAYAQQAPQENQNFGDYIKSLPPATAVSPLDQFYILQNGTSKQLPGSALPSGGGGGIGVPVTGTPQAGYVPQATSGTAAVWAAARLKLTAPLILFSSFASGTDQPTCGLSPGVNACKTIQYLYTNIMVTNYDTAGKPITLSFDSNDTGGLVINTSWLGGGQLTIKGPGGSPPAIGIVPPTGDGIAVETPIAASLNLRDMKLSGSQYALGVDNFAKVDICNINFAAGGIAHIAATANGAQIRASCGYTVSGGASAHWYAPTGGNIIIQVPVTLIGTPAFPTAFAAADTVAIIYCGGVTFSGAATGPRYLANLNAVVNCATSGNPTFLPGNAPGSVSNGGVYQ